MQRTMKKASAPTNASPAPVVSTTLVCSVGIMTGVGLSRVTNTDPRLPMVMITNIFILVKDNFSNRKVFIRVQPVGHFSSRAEDTLLMSSAVSIGLVLLI
jgi:hypothetical protein